MNSGRLTVPLRRFQRHRSVLTVLVLAALSFAVACEDDAANCSGDYCFCGNSNPDCFLACFDDDCNLECAHTANACGTVCGDQCQSLCHDTNNCSSFCENDCTATCHHAAVCGAECGERCSYSCSDTSRCGVRVGAGSTVNCTNVGSCAVECTGPCTVHCTNTSGRCDVTCPGLPLVNRGDGVHTCG